MAARESFLPDDRFARGKADLSAAEILLNNKGDPQVAAALVQQGVEKHIKGWPLSKGWRLARVHDLQRLLDDAAVHDKKLARHYRLCEKLTAFYFVDRYPFTVGPPDTTAVKDLLAEALKFVAELKP